MTAAPPADRVALVDRYLQCCEDRELDEAQRLLATDAVLVFPGGRRYASLVAMAREAAGAYRWVRKHRDRYFQAPLADGDTAVTSLGTLYGEDLAGRPFDGVRYVDVFVVRAGRISEQHVYNDLALADLALADLASASGTNDPPSSRTRYRP
ncbi:nuclear transport factor 2 family protein [Streptomyces oceani]|uniref:nuclear transport factor 2 family protein n=1 Tax=Streptomyces oceani TaxID=1075402 RepID=UPI000872A37F|nr:nuclear transport factor 2 family protein [Streptomyces oceani]